MNKKYLIAASVVVLAAATFVLIGLYQESKAPSVSIAGPNNESSLANPLAGIPQETARVPSPLSTTSPGLKQQSKVAYQQNVTAPPVAGTLQAGCNLILTFSSDRRGVLPGGTINYRVSVKNHGTDTCQDASLSAYYSDNESFVSASPVPKSSNYYWALGNVPSGSERNISISTLHQDGVNNPEVTPEVCVTANNGQDACGSLDISVGSTVLAEVSVSSRPVTAKLSSPQPSRHLSLTTIPQYGSWVWESPQAMSNSYKKFVLDTAVANRINVLYVTIDDYLKLNALPDGPDKTLQIQQYTASLENFIVMAGQRGIAVDAEAGHRDWSEEGRASAMAIVDYVKNFNATQPVKIRSFQYDVEPFLLPQYNENKSKILHNFVQFVAETAQRLQNSSIGFSIVIPHFYDDQVGWTPSFDYGGQNDFAFNHLLRIMDSRQGSEIVIMAYRNFALGDNSSTDLASTELQEAIGHSTKIIVAQEVGDVQPTLITFHGKTRADYLEQMQNIIDTFADNSAFGGVAVHYIDPFADLK